jgi:hypothetical protein
MIAFACGLLLLVVTCSWFGFDSIIFLDTYNFELTIKFTSIIKDNKLRLRVTYQPEIGVMKQILDGFC